MVQAELSPEDLEHLEQRGISPRDARRQLRFLSCPPAPQHLLRPCTVGDGIRRLEAADHDGLEERFARAEGAGRVTKLVPASGAASRMFQSLLPYLEHPREAQRDVLQGAAAKGDPGAAEVLRFVDNLKRFAFYGDLREAMAGLDASLAGALHQGDLGLLLRVLLGPEFLGFAGMPKALIPFHRIGGGSRTPLEEHLVEALSYARDSEGTCRLHFTVAAGDVPRFEAHSRAAAARLCKEVEAAAGARFDIGFSLQHPSTDTLALNRDGQPFRLSDGRLLLRPGGHGALLRNLDELGGDVVFIKNIDNVVPDAAKPPTLHWKRRLGGYLLARQEEIFARRRALEEGPRGVEEAIEFLVEELRVEAHHIPSGNERRSFAAEHLHRPIRVCGVVPNTGEPGGGPFWVRGGNGRSSRQIVEAAQIAKTPEQQEILGGATHFNPVDLVCGLRDFRGDPFELRRYVDPNTAFVSNKDHRGRPTRALERPGLWNGAMAYWHTLFVEVPSKTFAPVKTVFDLLRPEHQGE